MVNLKFSYKKIVKNRNLKISKIPNVVLWVPFRRYFNRSFDKSRLQFIEFIEVAFYGGGESYFSEKKSKCSA